MKPNEASSAQIDVLIDQYGPEIQKLINSTRRTLRAAFPGCAETADSKARLLGYSYGPGYKGTVATLILSKKGVKIGVPYGASLKDPQIYWPAKGGFIVMSLWLKLPIQKRRR
jgi:hypothetical protein